MEGMPLVIEGMDPRKTAVPRTPPSDPRKTAAMISSPPADLQPDSPSLGPTPLSLCPPLILAAAASLDTLDDDTVLVILNNLAQPSPYPQALARTAQCSRRLRRLAGSDRLWLALCRSAWPHSRLPAETGALQSCYAERVALPLRLASELDRAIGALQRLVALQVQGRAEAEEAESSAMEPPIYSGSGLDHTLVNLPPARSDADESGDAARLLPTTYPTIESLIMYRLFRAGLGLTTLTLPAAPAQRTPVDDHVPAAAPQDSSGSVAAVAAENEQLRLLLEECNSLLHESLASSRRGPNSGGWVVSWCVATQKRSLEQFDPWATGAMNWPDIPWRRSALGFLLQFFTASIAPPPVDGSSNHNDEVAAPPPVDGNSSSSHSDEVAERGWVTAVKRQVESFDVALCNVAEEGEDLSLPRRWVPRGLPRRGPEADAHKWWFQTADGRVLTAGFLWGNRC